MRDFLLKIYAYMRRLPEDRGLQAAAAVALAMLEPDDVLTGNGIFLHGGLAPEELPVSFLDQPANLSQAVGAALAMKAGNGGSVVVTPISAECAQGERFNALLNLIQERELPVCLLMECGADGSDDLEKQAAWGEIERIQADGANAMRLMPALRLAVDRAREGDGPTLIECIQDAEEEDEFTNPAARLADVLLTEGFATPEELI